jgi:oligoribonuclease
MKYISIDIETTGLDVKGCQIIEFGAIIEDTQKQLPFEKIPKFRKLLYFPQYTGEPYALAMHKELFSIIAAKNKPENEGKVIDAEDLAEMFAMWLVQNGIAVNTNTPIKINVAGKNFGPFDLQFLNNHFKWKRYIKISQRILDPAILYVDLEIDEALPDLSECKKRAGLQNITVAHTAVEDAWDVILLIRNKLK